MPFAATWWPGDYHTKWNKTDKDKYHMISLICRILKTWGNSLIYETEADSTDLKNELMVMVGEGRGNG